MAVEIAGVPELQETLRKNLVNADAATLKTLESQISEARRGIEVMRRGERKLQDEGSTREALVARTEILKAEALVSQAATQLREERSLPLRINLDTARDLVKATQRNLGEATNDAERKALGKVLAERQLEVQRLERELKAVLRF